MRNVVLGVDDAARLALENAELQNLAGGQVIIGNTSQVSVEGDVAVNAAAADIGLLRLQGSAILLGANVTTTEGGSITFAGPTTLNSSPMVTSGGSIVFTGTVNADAEANARSLTLSANGNITFQAAVGAIQRLQNLTITTAQDVAFNPGSTLALLGSLTQNAGTGTTVLRGGAIGGNLSLTTNAVIVAAASFDVAGTAQVVAQNAVTISTSLLVTGNVTLRANQDNAGAEDFVQADGTIIGRPIGNRDITIDVNGSGDAFLVNLQAGTGTVHVSAGGAIRDNSAAETPLITAAAAALEAGTGISLGADPLDLDLDVDVLAARTTSGSIVIEVGNALQIATVAGVVGLRIDGGSGGIDVTVTAGRSPSTPR